MPSTTDTPEGLDNVLAGQALFPIANLTEMVGDPGENEVADAVVPGEGRFPPIWNALMTRLKAIPEYVSLFQQAYDDVSTADDMTIAHYANAVAAFQALAFRSDNSPFDQYLRGNSDALSDQQVRGMDIFYGKANCSSCHSGKFQTDHQFYGIATPQFGPGPEDGLPLQDRGREEATGNPNDYAKFRTPSLRNVWVTKPYTHDGAYASLKNVVKHHLDPIASFESWNSRQVILPEHDQFDETDFLAYEDPILRDRVLGANDLQPVDLSNSEINDLLEFLRALTDWNALDMNWMIPDSVPSGLPVGD